MLKRDDRFSPNSVEKDLDILQSVAACLPYSNIIVMEESEILNITNSDIAERYQLIVSMARLPEVLNHLEELHRKGMYVINTAESVRHCQRSILERMMRDNSIVMPPLSGEHGWWIKRGDAAAQSRNDVRYCPDDKALEAAKRDFAARGIDNCTVSAHVVGDVVKFYGVGDGFFRYYYPTDDGQTKYDDEKINGEAHHYNFDVQHLHTEASRLSRLTGVAVYGGDAIVDNSGRFYIIDFNDWPSFSRCRDEAARAIAEYIIKDKTI